MPGGSGIYCSGGKHDRPSFFERERAECASSTPQTVFLYFVLIHFSFSFFSQYACANIKLAKAHRRPPRPPPQKKTGGASSPFSGGGREPWGGLPIPESGRWIWWERKKIGAHPSSFPSSDPSAIPTSTATAPPRWKRGRTVRNAGENSLLKESSQDAKCTQWKPSQCGQSAPSRVDSACFTPNHSQSYHSRTVCIPLVWCSVGREEYTICTWSAFHPYVPLSLPRLRHTGAFYVAGLVTWQTTVNKTHRTHRDLLNDKKLTPVAPHMLLSLLVIRHPPMTCCPSFGLITYDSEHGITEGVPLAFLTQLEIPRGTAFFCYNLQI